MHERLRCHFPLSKALYFRFSKKNKTIKKELLSIEREAKKLLLKMRNFTYILLPLPSRKKNGIFFNQMLISRVVEFFPIQQQQK